MPTYPFPSVFFLYDNEFYPPLVKETIIEYNKADCSVICQNDKAFFVQYCFYYLLFSL